MEMALSERGPDRRKAGAAWPTAFEIKQLIKDVHTEILGSKIVGDRLTDETARHFRADEELDREVLRRQNDFADSIRALTTATHTITGEVKDLRADMQRAHELSLERHNTFIQSYFNGYTSAQVTEMFHFTRIHMSEHAAQKQVLDRVKGDIVSRVLLAILSAVVVLMGAGVAVYLSKLP